MSPDSFTTSRPRSLEPQILIPLITWSVVNVTAEVNDFRLSSLGTNRALTVLHSFSRVCLMVQHLHKLSPLLSHRSSLAGRAR